MLKEFDTLIQCVLTVWFLQLLFDMCTMLQESGEAFGNPTFHGGINHTDEQNEKRESTGHSRNGFTVGFTITAIVALLLGAFYCYRKSWHKGRKPNFR
jgi:hypothetical protein